MEAQPPLHTNYPDDIDIKDGLLYASSWNDGMIVLDIGNGKKGGSPSNPTMVSQFKCDLNAMYKQVEVDGGPGFIRGTHTAWRHKNYVFIADEVFPAAYPNGHERRSGESSLRAVAGARRAGHCASQISGVV